MKFSRSKKIKFVKFHVFGDLFLGKYGRLKNCAKNMSKLWGKNFKKKLSDKRMSLENMED